jgi:hypothetical protein
MQTSLLFQLGNLLTLGLLAPWRRVGLARITHGDLQLGRLPVSANFSVKPLLLTYLPGWALSLAGFVYGSWYYWKNAIIPLQTVLNGGAADPAMGAQLDPSMFSGGMTGAASGDTMAQIGTFFNVLNLFFIVFPLWQMWKIVCLSPYEAAWWKHFLLGLYGRGGFTALRGELAGAVLDGGWFPFAAIFSPATCRVPSQPIAVSGIS